ncbi:MAG: AEC family transporter [Pseudomonadota bacterium]
MGLQILEITAPVFLLGFVGWLWARLGAPYDIPFVTRLATQLAMPCLIFSTLARAEIEPAALSEMALATLALYGALAAVFAAGLRAAGLRLRTFLPPTVVNNTGNLGLPVALYAFGDEGLALSIVLFAIMVSLQFSLGLWFVAGRGRGWEAARQPMVWAALGGVATSVAGLRPPDVLDESIALIGQLGIPLMLLTLGVSISRIAVGGVARAAALSVIRAAVGVGLAMGVGWALDLSGLVYAVLVLQAVMPAPVTNYLIALQYDADPEDVAALVVVSTLFSILFIPLTLAFLAPGV